MTNTWHFLILYLTLLLYMAAFLPVPPWSFQCVFYFYNCRIICGSELDWCTQDLNWRVLVKRIVPLVCSHQTDGFYSLSLSKLMSTRSQSGFCGSQFLLRKKDGALAQLVLIVQIVFHEEIFLRENTPGIFLFDGREDLSFFTNLKFCFHSISVFYLCLDAVDCKHQALFQLCQPPSSSCATYCLSTITTINLTFISVVSKQSKSRFSFSSLLLLFPITLLCMKISLKTPLLPSANDDQGGSAPPDATHKTVAVTFTT